MKIYVYSVLFITIFDCADESGESYSVIVVEYTGCYRGNHDTCDNDSDTIPVLFGRYSVADNYIEQHRRFRAVDCHLTCQHGPERGDKRADDISAAAAEYNHHGRQYQAAIQRDGDHREVRHRGNSSETISVSSRYRSTIKTIKENHFAIENWFWIVKSVIYNLALQM